MKALSNNITEEVIKIKQNCFVNQTSVNDCGAACLTMILKLKGVNTTLEDVKKQMCFSQKGVSAYDIVKVSNQNGVIANGYKGVSLNDAKTPFIAHIINDNGTQHFIVVLKVLKKRVLIADPARKIMYVDKSEFLSKYTKIAIMFDEDKNILKEILNNKIVVLKIIIVTLLLVLLNVFFSCLVPFIINLIDNNNINLVHLSLFIFLIIGVLKDVINYLRNILILHFRIITDKVITIPTLKKLINLPHKFYHLNGPGELISKVNDLSYIKEAIFNVIEVLIISVLLVFISIIIVSSFNIGLFLINLLFILILFLINKSFLKKHLSKTYDLQLSNEVLNSNLVDTFNSITMIKNLSKEEYFNARITKSYNDVLTKYKKINTIYYKKDIITSIILSLFTIFILFFVIINFNNTSDILFVMSIQNIIISSISEIFNLSSLYADFKSSYHRAKVIFNEKQINNSKEFINIQNIQFKNISYKYRDNFVLKGISFEINKGDWIMVNGPSASGKSTLFKLLCKQISTMNNEIYINKKSIKEYSYDEIRNSITYVDQKLRLFNSSIKENIFMETKINKKVLKTALINDVLKENNITLDYVIDNNNSNLSGGGISKIAIAQSLNLNKDVIIFDETTSSLDIKTEKLILNNIKKYYKDKTIILITHRNSNTKYFNKIITLENGKLKFNKGGYSEKTRN